MREIKFKGFNPKSEYRDEPVMSEPFQVGSALSEYSWDILLQFTGLHDKNGKEIYEGDVVVCDGGTLPAQVVWYNGAWALDTLNPETIQNPLELYYFEEATVIGNIHENPELIKEQK